MIHNYSKNQIVVLLIIDLFYLYVLCVVLVKSIYYQQAPTQIGRYTTKKE